MNGVYFTEVHREGFLINGPKMIRRRRAFQVEGTVRAKTMSLGLAWCVHKIAIRHCISSRVDRKKRDWNEYHLRMARPLILFWMRWEQNWRVLSRE